MNDAPCTIFEISVMLLQLVAISLAVGVVGIVVGFSTGFLIRMIFG